MTKLLIYDIIITERKRERIAQHKVLRYTMMMTVEEARARIEELETKIFLLAMKDFWDRRDFEEDDKMNREVLTLKKTYNL